MLDVYFLLGVGYSFALSMQQKKLGANVRLWAWGGGVVWGYRGAGVQGCRGTGGAGRKAKKIRAKQKKINPPYQKNSDFAWA